MKRVESKAKYWMFLKRLQIIVKSMPEWGLLLYAWTTSTIIPLLVFTEAWKSLGTLVLAFKVCAPLFLAIGIINGLVLFLYYYEDEID